MMKCVEEVLCGQGGNYILPFLWLHGEEQERILEEMDSIEKCGIRAFCVESRPHPAFGEALWWEQHDTGGGPETEYGGLGAGR